MIPALTISSLNLPIVARSSVLGITPASLFSSALTITMKRIVPSRAAKCVACHRRSCVRRGFPQPHHPALGVGKERKRAHARHGLLFDTDLAARRDDPLAVGREVGNVDIEQHIARPRSLAIGLYDPSIDALLAARLDD